MKPQLVIQKHVPMMARDGTMLATDCYFPDDEETQPWPAILLRTPYDKEAPSRVAMAERWAAAGYAVVVQDCRGRFASEGIFKLGLNEAEDGYDAVEWTAAKPWCNGRVGTIGTSYMAWVQSALATLNPPHLTCMWVHEGIANGLKESLRQGGAFELRWMGWAFYGAATDPHLTARQRHRLEEVDLRDWLSCRLPKAGESPLAWVPNMESWFLEYLATGTRGGALDYRGIDIEAHYGEHADVPTVYSGGWYDSYTRATIRNWSELSRRKESPQFLLMGPWTHGSQEPGLTFAGDIDLGPDAALDYFEVRRPWFDYWLKGEGTNPRPRVQYFLMGGGTGQMTAEGRLDHGGRWLIGETWPPPEAVTQAWYGTPSGGLTTELPGDRGTLRFVSDPDHPVPTVGGNLSFLKYFRQIPEDLWPLIAAADRLEAVSPIGGQNQVTHPGIFGGGPPYGPLNQRPDIVSLVSEPLKEPLTVTGPVAVELTLASDARDTDITVKLIDWYPPSEAYPLGYALNITDGIQRLRFREGTTKEVPYEPSSTIRLRVECYPTANLFMPGHRLRLDIAGSNFPRFDINPNTGAALGDNRERVVAHQTLTLDPEHPLRLELTTWQDAGDA